MQIIDMDIPDVKLITPKKFGDDRGFFSEVYNANNLKDVGIQDVFVQDNHSLSAAVGVVRGLHFQIGAAVQSKLVRVLAGSILDVVVDIRVGSPTFGHHVKAVLSRENWQQLYVPHGFAHGFCTLEPNTEVQYKVDRFYSPENERGILWNDPALKIEWGEASANPTLSAKDLENPVLADSPEYFTYN